LSHNRLLWFADFCSADAEVVSLFFILPISDSAGDAGQNHAVLGPK
jgi:hypothetical protein